MKDGKAEIKEVKEYFGYPSLNAFKKDWVVLTDEEKDYFLNGVGEIISSVVNG